jgi:hypothetical protein
MDDMAFASFTSSKARSKSVDFGESKVLAEVYLCILTLLVGDAMVREIDLSRITVRLVEKIDKKGEGDEDHVLAKLSGDLLPVLQRCLVSIFFLKKKNQTDEYSILKVSSHLAMAMTLARSKFS